MKHIWYQNTKWKIAKIFKPNKYDRYIVAFHSDKDSIHGDGKTIPIDMILFDAFNDVYNFSSKKIDLLYHELNNCDSAKRQAEIKKQLSDHWLYIDTKKLKSKHTI